MSNTNFSLKKTFRLLLPVFFLCMLFLVGTGIPQALADSGVVARHNQNPVLIADSLTGEGIGNQVQGKANEALGKTQREFGGVDEQAEGALRETKGKAEQAAGKAKVSLDRAGDKAGNALNKAGNRAEEAGAGFVDKIKGLFD